MRKYIYPIFLFLILSLSSSAAISKDFIANGPLVSRTQNPIYLQTLGQIPMSARVLDRLRYSNWVGFDYSNIFDWGQSGNNEVLLDMELARISLNFFYGIGRDMEVGIQVPLLHFNGGYFDSWIQDFHKFFGFPNGGRENFPNGMFQYRITQNGNVIYNVKRQALGLSDIILAYKYNFLPETDVLPGFALTLRFKIPSGRPESGTGSGKPDYSWGFIVEKSIKRWHFYTNVDYIVDGGHKVLGDLYNSQMFAWLTTVEFSVSQPVSLLLQLQGSTPLLTGLGTNKWNGIPMDLIFGVKGTHKNLFWGNDFFWQWSFSEDVASEGPSVDLTTMLVAGIKFGF